MQDLYKNNSDFRGYVNRYCRTYRRRVEEALQHKLVQEAGEQYKEQEGKEKVV